MLLTLGDAQLLKRKEKSRRGVLRWKRMKKGKGEEKVMGPMFPRLHVNDTEKGGPRAPPRNKMALYEQLSIPSQRSNPSDSPLNTNNTGNLASPRSSQGNALERGVFFSRQLPALYPVEKPHGRTSSSNTSLRKVDSRKLTQENEYRVPIFVNSKVDQAQRKFYNNLDKEKLTPSNQVLSGCLNKEVKEITGLSTRHHGKRQNEDSIEFAVSTENCCKGTSDSLSRNKPEGILKQADQLLHFEPRDDLANTFGQLRKTKIVRLECGSDSQVDCTVIFESVRGVDNGDSFRLKDFASEEQINNNNLINDMESQEDNTCKSSPTGIMDQSDDLSETSMVEYVSEMDISPDDVVRIIGQKHFWKARRAIANQQRVLAVQVFELHRLLKVQKLIAGSPNVLLEDSAFSGKPLKSLSAKTLPLEYSVKAPQNVSKPKNYSEKPNSRTECNAENNVGKTSPPSVQNGVQPSSFRPFSENPPPTPGKYESHMGPWCLNQPSGHQWLVPVMSPSEGLVYKPHPGHAFMSPIYGGCGPPALTPMTGNFLAPQYGGSASHPFYQGTGVPFAPPMGHGYFPPFGMPVMNPVNPSPAIDQSNQVAVMGFQGQLAGGGANFNNQRHNSSNIASEKNGTVPKAVKLYPSRDSELQASTASSPSERAHGVDMGNSAERSSVFRLFPTNPAIGNPDLSSQHHLPIHRARVIKVVPHNARSAPESAARIFQSIQEERKQY